MIYAFTFHDWYIEGESYEDMVSRMKKIEKKRQEGLDLFASHYKFLYI